MSDTKIQVFDNGPYLVNGDFEIVDGQGNKFEKKESVYLCRCGKSTNMPFCTGAHKTDFNSIVRANEE